MLLHSRGFFLMRDTALQLSPAVGTVAITVAQASQVVLAWRREHIDHLAGLKHCDRVLDLTGYDVTVPGA